MGLRSAAPRVLAGLAVVLVGERPDSCLYVSRKQEAAERAGIACEVHRLAQDVSQEALCAKVASLCADSAVDGVIVQLPLPKHLDEEVIGALSTGNRDFLAG
ncbi:Bifunctional protein folD [Monoraphidium neglectum]|uniref:Bifunctional protein folD n=1 Tax=Monoraphidium neglectum TaxID=145388 RepID=A0A0D2MUA5_9CHLO|nr:Bifunctional protein folD [Monoraphidium neglectum]KIZ04092.1 Bifunctional protein folD [Monoraphidium neglectum]|eukprot:XP_013903111.1 Bifunctional protein folD [Monoraphidium neglectum]